LLANWDKKGENDEQYFKSFVWNGKELVEQFSIDFKKEKLGRAHQMRFGAYSLYKIADKSYPSLNGKKIAKSESDKN